MPPSTLVGVDPTSGPLSGLFPEDPLLHAATRTKPPTDKDLALFMGRPPRGPT